MNKWVTNKNVLLGSAIVAGLFMIMLVLVEIWGCNESLFFFCRDSFIWIIDYMRIFVPLFLLSLITYKMHDQVFISWRRFVVWWIPLTIFFVILAPESDSSLIPIDKGRVSFGMSILFLVISLILIGWKWFALRKK